VARDRRWDHLYDRQKVPVRQYVVERFAAELGGELAAWPLPEAELRDWIPDDLRWRWRAGLEARPRDAVVRLGIHAAARELERDWDGAEALVAGAALGAEEEASARLLVRFLTEKALAFQEWAEGAKLRRADLAEAVRLAERSAFRVVPG
jgi:hypothetical protein